MSGGMSGIIAGRAFVVIRAIDATGQGLRAAGQRVGQWAKSMRSASIEMMKAGSILLSPFILSAKEFVNFDNAMKKVEARSTGTAGELKGLREQIKELNKDVVFTSSAIANAAASLGQKGFSRDQISGMIEGVTMLARAGGEGTNFDEDLANSVTVIAGTIRAFKMEAGEAGRIADVMTAAINSSNFTLAEMIAGMKDAEPIAKRYNISLEEMVTTLGMMTDVAIPAESASKAFRNMLMRMSNETHRSGFKERIQELTGETVKFADAAGNLLPMHEILFNIGNSIKNLGTMEQGEILGDLFGMRALVAAGQLADSSERWKELFVEIAQSSGEAKKTAELMDSGIGGAWNRLISSLGVLKIEIMETINGGLIAMGEGIKWLVDTTSNWVKNNKNLVRTLFLVGSAVMTAGIGLFILATGAQLVAWTITGLGIAFSLLTTLVTGVATAITAVFTSVPLALATVVTVVLAKLGVIQAVFGEAFGHIWNIVKKTFGGIIEALGKGGISEAWHVATAGMASMWSTTMTILSEAWAGFANFFFSIWKDIQSSFKKGMADLQADLTGGFLMMAGTEGIVGDMWTAILGVDVREEHKRAKEMGNEDNTLGAHIARVYDEADEKKQNIDQEAEKAKSDFAASLAKMNKKNDELRLKDQELLNDALASVEKLDPFAGSDKEKKEALDVEEETKEAVKDMGKKAGFDARYGQAIDGMEKGTKEAWKQAIQNNLNAKENRDRKHDELLEAIKEAGEAAGMGEEVEGV